MSSHPRPTILQIAALDYAFRVHLLPLVRALELADFNVICCGPVGPFTQELRDNGINYAEVPFARTLNPVQQLRAFAKLLSWVRSNPIDVIHTHTAVAGAVGRAAARVAGVPKIVHTIHGLHTLAMPSVSACFFTACERWGARQSDFIFVQNEEDGRTVASWQALPSMCIRNIGNGIDLSRFDPAKVSQQALNAVRLELGLNTNCHVVTFIGRPTEDKGARDVLDVAEHLSKSRPDIFFVCVLPSLPGERRSILSSFHHHADRCRLRLLEFRTDVPAILALTDVFFLPSRYEGLSKSIIEAMAMALPVVTTNVRGCRDLIYENVTGHLLNPGDVRSMAQRICALVDEPERRRDMGNRARAQALERYSEEAMLQIQVQVISELLFRRNHQ